LNYARSLNYSLFCLRLSCFSDEYFSTAPAYRQEIWQVKMVIFAHSFFIWIRSNYTTTRSSWQKWTW